MRNTLYINYSILAKHRAKEARELLLIFFFKLGCGQSSNCAAIWLNDNSKKFIIDYLRPYLFQDLNLID